MQLFFFDYVAPQSSLTDPNQPLRPAPRLWPLTEQDVWKPDGITMRRVTLSPGARLTAPWLLLPPTRSRSPVMHS